MSTPVIDVRTAAGRRDGIARAVEVLRRGGLVAFPTETVYGLGAHALNSSAVERIFQAKGRPATNPVIVHVADVLVARQLSADWSEAADTLAARFWPGALTLVVPRREEVPSIVTAGGPTVALRIPSHPVALELLRASGLPIAAPSANRSNRLSPTRAEHVQRDLDGRVDLILDGGPTSGGIESTVVDVTRTPVRLLRPGLISPVALEAIVGRLELSASSTEGALPSPGMLARHYAPRTPLELVEDDGFHRTATLRTAGLRVALVGTLARGPEGVIAVTMPNDPEGYAQALYATLHELDDQHLDRIVVTMPPDAQEWLAVRDRLRRAATP